jgi:hypothetical protein
MYLLQLVMDGRYRSCYAVGCTARHRQRTGKLFRFPRNPVRYVHKVIEQIYDHLFVCHTTHFRCQTEFKNFHIVTFVWSLDVVSCVTIRVADDDCKNDGNILVVNNEMKHILYIYICWLHYVRVISSWLHYWFIYLAGASTNVWRRVRIVTTSLF